MNKLTKLISKNIKNTILISSVTVIVGKIFFFGINSEKKPENENNKNNKKKKNQKLSKRTFLSENENSDNDNYNETDFPYKKKSKKFYNKTFQTDLESLKSKKRRNFNFKNKENKKIDDLYFAMLNNLNKEN